MELGWTYVYVYKTYEDVILNGIMYVFHYFITYFNAKPSSHYLRKITATLIDLKIIIGYIAKSPYQGYCCADVTCSIFFFFFFYYHPFDVLCFSQN